MEAPPLGNTAFDASVADSPGQSDEAASAKITPELVRQVADKVFMLMLRDVKIERERVRSLLSGGRR